MLESTGDVVTATIRGGWGGFLASVATIMEYYIGSHHTLSLGGKAIAGWSNPARHVYAPSCESLLSVMTVSEKTAFQNFLTTLFGAAHFQIMESNIRQFAYCMFASLVQYLSEFIAKYGSSHIVVVTLLRVARQFNISLAKLLAWGKEVGEEWALRNVVNVDSSGDLLPVVIKLQEEIIALKAQNTELMQRGDRSEKKLDIVEKKLDSADKKIDQILSLLAAPVTQLPSPGHKRSRGASPAKADTTSTPPSIITPAPPVTSVVLLPPSPVFQISGKMSMYELYRVWYHRKYTDVNATGRWSADTKQITSAVKSAMKYTEEVITPELRAELNAPAPSVDDASYSDWNKSYLNACRSLVELVTVTLHAADGSKFQSVASINAVAGRRSAILRKSGQSGKKKKK